MKFYSVPMIPGPSRISPVAKKMYVEDFGAGYLEDEFFDLYEQTGDSLRRMTGTTNEFVIQSGEAMAILWGSLKSVLNSGDRLLCVSTGFFGEGFADMAASFGVETRTVSYGYDETIHDLTRVEDAIREFRPKAITVVHCETPSGTLNPLAGLGALKTKNQVPLLLVDAVASIGCAPIEADAWGIDILMGGSQKGLSLAPNLGFCSVSETAWDIIDQVNYVGYEAFKPWRKLTETRAHPNTPDWNGIAALKAVLDSLEEEGLEQVYQRHEEVAGLCRNGLTALGYRLFPKPEAIPSPSVTAAYIPESMDFAEFDRRVRAHGMGIGGSYGPLEGKVFRLGHMGIQASAELLQAALEVLRKVR